LRNVTHQTKSTSEEDLGMILITHQGCQSCFK
jgi:hypothetical protein